MLLLNKEIISAVKNRNYIEIGRLLDNGVDISSVDEFGYAPIHHAVQDSDLELMEYLTRNGANLRHATQDGMYPLAIATINGDISSLYFLSSQCADYESPVYGSPSCLEYSLISGNTKISEFLISHGADIENISDEGDSLMIRMAKNGKQNSVRILIAAGANPYLIDSLGNTALDYLISGKFISIKTLVKFPIELRISTIKKHNIIKNLNTVKLAISSAPGNFKRFTSSKILNLKNQRDSNYNNHLISYIRQGDLDKASSEISNGADVNFIDVNGVPVIIHAVRAITALRAGHPITEWNNRKITQPLTNFIAALINHGCNFNIKDQSTGSNIMHEACQTNNLDLMSYLLTDRRTRSLINKPDKNFNRAIHTAAHFNCPSLIDWLCKSGADMNSFNSDGHTPLQISAELMDEYSIKVLVDSNANIYLNTISGKSIDSLLDKTNNKYQKIHQLFIKKIFEDKSVDAFTRNNPFIKLLETDTNQKEINIEREEILKTIFPTGFIKDLT